jgi:hypothetical protein
MGASVASMIFGDGTHLLCPNLKTIVASGGMEVCDGAHRLFVMKKIRRHICSWFSVCSPENKFLDGGLTGPAFLGSLASWGVYWLVISGTPSPTRSIGIKTLAGFFCQSIERKRLRGKVLIALDLGPLLLLLWAPGWAVLLSLDVGPPFRPDQKVKIDKSEAGRGGLFLRNGLLALTMGLSKSSKGKGSSRGPPARLLDRFDGVWSKENRLASGDARTHQKRAPHHAGGTAPGCGGTSRFSLPT